MASPSEGDGAGRRLGGRIWRGAIYVVTRLLTALVLLFTVLLTGMFAKLALTPMQRQPTGTDQPLVLPSPVEQAQLAERLGQALRIPTVSIDGKPPAAEPLRAFHAQLQASFPSVHATLAPEKINDFALLYAWRGQDPSRKPYALLAHQDVVPVEAGTESRWHKPPFSGAVEEGMVWGRGAVDDKMNLMAILEAVERLLRLGYKPQRTLYLAFGHDEEVSGRQGAVALAALLKQRSIHLDFVLDEGQAVVHDLIPGVKRHVALIGLAEKGYLSVELTVTGTGGHSSMPPPHTAVGILSQAITRLEQHQMPARLAGPTGALFAALGPEMALPQRLIMTNLWLLKPLVLALMAHQPATNASVRTTTAATMFEGSPKDNVLPQRARAVVNFRLLPGDSSQEVLAHIRAVVDDPRVAVQAIPDSLHEPSSESRIDSAAFAVLSATIHQAFPEAVVAPTLTIGATDSRHYAEVADNVYRFGPHLVGPEDLGRVHGTDERVPVESYARAVAFYERLIRNADASSP